MCQVDDDAVAAWQQLERRIVAEAWDVPVYFAPSTPALVAVYDDLYAGSLVRITARACNCHPWKLSGCSVFWRRRMA